MSSRFSHMFRWKGRDFFSLPAVKRKAKSSRAPASASRQCPCTSAGSAAAPQRPPSKRFSNPIPANIPPSACERKRGEISAKLTGKPIWKGAGNSRGNQFGK
eukprot:1539375-Pyramimonas_sp.AAC.1